MLVNTIMILLTCQTLFNITVTGVLNRAKPEIGVDPNEWLLKRNTQCNYDTIIQVISLRSQPENMTIPKKAIGKADKFGYLYQKKKNYTIWQFEFEIQHHSVFENGITPLGALYNDCDGVPMIKCDEQYDKLQLVLNTSLELKNIHFEVIKNV